MTNTITRFGATIITTATILAGAAPAMATPHPYERDKALSLRVGEIAERVADTVKSPKGEAHAKPIRIRWADRGERELHPYARGSYTGPTTARALRMIPRPGSDGTNALCRSGSKAARWAC
jgi:hypothetical protein